LVLVIAGSPLLAQEPDEKRKPKREEPRKQPEPKAKPAQEPDEKPKAKPKPEKANPEPSSPPKQQKPDEKQPQPDEKERQKQQKEQAKKEQNRATQGQNTQQNAKQSASGKGQRIPPQQFRASFGREHHFRVARSGGDNRRFQYGGYWFEVVEFWPAGWSFDEDCYIEEDGDDYYLVEVVRPEIRVLVIVVGG